jgi:hypothetical protein
LPGPSHPAATTTDGVLLDLKKDLRRNLRGLQRTTTGARKEPA